MSSLGEIDAGIAPYSLFSSNVKTKSHHDRGMMFGARPVKSSDVADSQTFRAYSTPTFPPGSIFEDMEKMEKMKNEKHRIASFYRWPHQWLSVVRMAHEGFFFTGEKDIVQCAFCKIRLIRWKPGDTPINQHRNFSPDCSFVKGVNCGNIPFDINATHVR